VWVAHYSAAGKQLFSKRSPAARTRRRLQRHRVASDDGHRAVLTGGFGPDGLCAEPVGRPDRRDRGASPVLAESNDALTGYWGNDILINKYGQFEVAGQRIVGGDDLDMAHQSTTTRRARRSSPSVGLTYGDPDVIRVSPPRSSRTSDGTVTLMGTLTEREPTAPRRRSSSTRSTRSFFADGWPFTITGEIAKEAPARSMARSTALGNLQLDRMVASEDPNDASQMMTLTVDPREAGGRPRIGASPS
jgi:hypothetical protein